MATIGARLKHDGTLITAGELDEYTHTTHKITQTNVFCNEFDEVTLDPLYSSGGSVLLNGTTQQLTLGTTNDFAFGTNNFTVEGWFYSTTNTYQRLWCFPGGDNVEVLGTTVYYWNGSSIGNSGSGIFKQWTWNHVALVKLDGVVTVYVNGTSRITDISPHNSSMTRQLAIGGELASEDVGGQQPVTGQDGWFKGYITNFRIVKGTAMYTENFNRSYSPLTADANTKLLLLFADKAGLLTDSSGTSKIVTNVGGARFDATSPLATANNGVMKQLKNGTLRVTNEFDEYNGGAGSIS